MLYVPIQNEEQTAELPLGTFLRRGSSQSLLKSPAGSPTNRIGPDDEGQESGREAKKHGNEVPAVQENEEEEGEEEEEDESEEEVHQVDVGSMDLRSLKQVRKALSVLFCFSHAPIVSRSFCLKP